MSRRSKRRRQRRAQGLPNRRTKAAPQGKVTTEAFPEFDPLPVAAALAAGIRIEEYRQKVATPKVPKDAWLRAVLTTDTPLEFRLVMTHVYDVASDDGDWNTWELEDHLGFARGSLS